MDEIALKKKLAKFAGFIDTRQMRRRVSMAGLETVWLFPDGTKTINLPDFPNDLTACFKWFPDIFHQISFVYYPKKWRSPEATGRVKAIVYHDLDQYEGEALEKQEALALCLAAEKVVDSGARDGA